MKLNLCSSDQLLDDYLNVDRVLPCDLLVDLETEWPWEDSSVTEVRAHDALEHLTDPIRTMNQIHRILVPKGRLDLFIPTTDGRGAWQDPTHRSWWNPNTLYYFVSDFAEWQRFHKAYGITANFRVLQQDHILYPGQVWKLRAVLEAIK